MPWPSSAVNSGPRRLSQAHGITETCRNSQPTCSAASCSSPADRPDVQSQVKNNLYKVWNRMASGSYHPPPVRLVEIPKATSGTRPLGIPTVSDRVAQTMVTMVLEPLVESHFHPDSYAYRPGRSALDAVGTARKRCWRTDWVIDLDIKAFFDSMPRDLIERAVAHHTDLAWVKLYVGRWLRAPVEHPNGTLEERTKGTPQGGVVTPPTMVQTAVVL